jgi:hypothetical protein
MFSATFEGTSRIVLVVTRPVVALLRSLEALGQEREELFRGPKSQLTAGVHFLDPALEPLVRFAIWAELQDERPSHHEVSVRR